MKELNKMKSFSRKEWYIKTKDKRKSYRDNYRKNNRWTKTWNCIQQRCENPNNPSYEHYGKRGIKNKFKNPTELKFLWFRDKAYLMEKPSIDRIDNDGNYCIKNCQYIELSDNVIKESSKITLQFTKNGKLIKEWISAREASRTLKIDEGNLNKSLLNKRPSAGGYIWKYKEIQ
jgi:hypothetical protein